VYSCGWLSPTRTCVLYFFDIHAFLISASVARRSRVHHLGANRFGRYLLLGIVTTVQRARLVDSVVYVSRLYRGIMIILQPHRAGIVHVYVLRASSASLYRPSVSDTACELILLRSFVVPCLWLPAANAAGTPSIRCPVCSQNMVLIHQTSCPVKKTSPNVQCPSSHCYGLCVPVVIIKVIPPTRRVLISTSSTEWWEQDSMAEHELDRHCFQASRDIATAEPLTSLPQISSPKEPST